MKYRPWIKSKAEMVGYTWEIVMVLVEWNFHLLVEATFP